MIKDVKKKMDAIRYNLNLRSKGQPASQYEWDNPIEADGVPILTRSKATKSDPNIKVTYNNFQIIQKNKAGYLANIKRVFSDNISEDVQKKYKEFDNLNHTKSLFKKMIFSCAGWGNTYSLCYLDEQKRVRIKQVNAWNACVEYDDNDEPKEAYIYYTEKTKEGSKNYVFEYDFINVIKYEVKGDKKTEVEPAKPHGFIGIPVIEWQNNDNKQGNAELAVTLLDAYDTLMSDNITENAALRSAYLLMKNLGTMTDEQKEMLKKSGIFQVMGDGDVKFIQKNINPEFVKLLIEEIWSSIWIVSSSVDPKALGSLSNATAFQIAQMYRMMEEDCKDTELEWMISLEYLDRILKSYWTRLDLITVKDYSTEEISYDFVRNIPKDVMTWLKDLAQSGGRLPQVEIFKKAGYDEKKAEELAEEASQESIDMLPDVEV